MLFEHLIKQYSLDVHVFKLSWSSILKPTVQMNLDEMRWRSLVPFFFFLWRCDPTRVMDSSFLRFLDHTQCTTVGRTPLDEWSARHRDLYLTTQNTHNRQTSMPVVGFKTTISAGERRQTYALHRAATGTGIWFPYSTATAQIRSVQWSSVFH